MLKINKNIQSEILMTTMEEIVPNESLFRKIDRYIDFTFIYDEVKDLYCENNGRPSIDPVVLFKLVFIQALDGIKSMRKTCEKIKVDAEYRWFLGIPFGQDTPHFSTFSKNYERRFKRTDIFENIFINIVKQAQKYGMLNDEFFMDSTHRKANANKNKYEDQIVEQIKKRKLDLEEEINEERKRIGQKPFDYKDEIEKKHIKVSKTDQESGYYHRDNKEKGFMYLEHRTVNGKCNIITDAYVTKGNLHDSVVCTRRLEYQKNKLDLNINKVALDSGYDTYDIKKYFEDNNIFGVIQYRSYGQGNTEIRKWQFKYLEEEDVYVCPKTGIVLPYRNIDKFGYKKYYDRKQCEGCPYQKQCCGKSKFRTIRRLICEEVNERARERRLSSEGKELFKKRKTTVERSFGDSKQNHGYRYTLFKGVKKNQAYTHLICAAQNMKNIAIKRTNIDEDVYNNSIFINIFAKIRKNIKNTQKKTSHFFKMWGLSTIWGVQKCTPFACFVQFLFILICYKMKTPRKNKFKSALLLSQDISYILIIMDKEEFINIFILKSVLRDNKLTFLERLLLIHIISLCKKNGYCWATNRYFCDIYNVTQVTISKSISNLATFGYIKTEYDNKGTNNSKRIIKLSEVLNLKLKSIKDNFNTGYKQNFKQYNNKLNKKEDSIYYKDEDGNEYWHGKLIPKNEATVEEQEELKKLLSDIYEEE